MEYRLDQAKEILRRTPATLNALLSDLPNDWVLANEGPETFSPYDVIGHLIEGEENDWIPRARIILEHGEARPFEKFDRFAMYEKSKGKSPAELLRRFEEDGLDITAKYRSSEGTPYQNTFRELLTHVLTHSSIHRGNILLKLRDDGFEPPKIDYIIYLRETKYI